MGLYEFLRYIVVKALAGEVDKVMALRDVLNGASPSEVAMKYGFSKHQVRGFALRLRDHQVPEWMARKILDLGWCHIISIKPILVRNNGTLYCLLCRAPIAPSTRNIGWMHVAEHHSDLVDQIVVDLARKIRDEMKTRRVGA